MDGSNSATHGLKNSGELLCIDVFYSHNVRSSDFSLGWLDSSCVQAFG